MSATNDNLNKSAENLLGPSIVKVLQENLSTGSQQTQRKKTPCGRKITPGKPIESLEEPCSSGINSKKQRNKEAEEDFSVAHIKKGKPAAYKIGKVEGNSKLQKGQEWREKKTHRFVANVMRNMMRMICVSGWSAIHADNDFIWNVWELNIKPKIIGHLILMLITLNVLSVRQFLKVVENRFQLQRYLYLKCHVFFPVDAFKVCYS